MSHVQYLYITLEILQRFIEGSNLTKTVKVVLVIGQFGMPYSIYRQPGSSPFNDTALGVTGKTLATSFSFLKTKSPRFQADLIQCANRAMRQHVKDN